MASSGAAREDFWLGAMSLRRAFERVNPFRLARKHVRQPIESFLLCKLDNYRRRTNEGINSVREVVYKSGVAAVFASAVLWLSIFLYVAFYYTYMPNVTHMRPVHLQFKSCDELPGVCSFPSAHVQLTRHNQMLMVGQPYRIRLVLDMPESQVNKDLGMFMVCAQLRSRRGTLVSSSCRSAMLRHRSPLHELLRTIALAPLLLANLNEEKQQLQVELFSDFEDDQALPVTDAYVELQTRHAQLYRAALHIEAHFSGLRYLMFNWPVVSAALGESYKPNMATQSSGISTNLFFVALIFVLSWYHLQEKALSGFVKMGDSGQEMDELDGENKFALRGKLKLERDDSFLQETSFLDDAPMVEDEMARALNT